MLDFFNKPSKYRIDQTAANAAKGVTSETSFRPPNSGRKPKVSTAIFYRYSIF